MAIPSLMASCDTRLSSSPKEKRASQDFQVGNSLPDLKIPRGKLRGIFKTLFNYDARVMHHC